MKDLIIGAILMLMAICIINLIMDLKSVKDENDGKIITAERSITILT